MKVFHLPAWRIEDERVTARELTALLTAFLTATMLLECLMILGCEVDVEVIILELEDVDLSGLLHS